MDLQIAMVQGAMYPIVLTKLSTDYNVAEQKYNYFNMRDVSVISVCPSVCPSICPSVRPSVHPSVRPSVCLYPIVLTKLSTDYNVAEQKYNYFNMRDVSVISVCLSVCPSFRPCTRSF